MSHLESNHSGTTNTITTNINEEEEEALIDLLPWDCMWSIFSYLDAKELARLAFVSRRWRHMSSQDPLVRLVRQTDGWMDWQNERHRLAQWLECLTPLTVD